MMSAGAIGITIGLILAAIEFAVLRKVGERVEKDETRKALQFAGLAQFVLFPVIGFFVARTVFGE